jgi:hypothetical protein
VASVRLRGPLAVARDSLTSKPPRLFVVTYARVGTLYHYPHSGYGA